MAKKNDQIILKLQDQIKEKEAQLEKGSKFNPLTNCNITLYNIRYNINVLSKEEIVLLLAQLQALKNGLSDIIPEEELEISGFKVSMWITDLISKYRIQNRKAEEDRLKTLKSKLYLLLSTDTKVSLELESLMNQI